MVLVTRHNVHLLAAYRGGSSKFRKWGRRSSGENEKKRENSRSCIRKALVKKMKENPDLHNATLKDVCHQLVLVPQVKKFVQFLTCTQGRNR